MLLSLFECKISTVWAHSQDFCMILYKKTVFLDKGQEASLGLPDSLPFSLQTRLIIATSPEVGHEQKHTDVGDDYGHQNPPLAECVVKSMHECRDGHGEEIERMTVTRIEIGESNEIAGYTTPDGVKEGQTGESGNVPVKCRGVVKAYIHSGLILHPLEHAEGNARHESVEDKRTWQDRLFRPSRDDKERHHLRQFFCQSHAEDKAQQVDGERRLRECIKRVEPNKSEDIPHDKHEEVGHKEDGDGGA